MRRDRVDVGVVAEAHQQQVAVGERRALGPAGRAARVEQPGRIVRPAVDERRGRRRREPLPLLAGCDDRRRERDVAGVLGVGHDDGRPAVLEDEGDLVAVQAGVDRDGHEAGVPDGEQRLEVLGPVAHQDRHAVTGREAEVVAQAGGRGRGPGGERRPRRVHALAVRQGRGVRPQATVARHPHGRVQRGRPECPAAWRAVLARHRRSASASSARLRATDPPVALLAGSSSSSRRRADATAGRGSPRPPCGGAPHGRTGPRRAATSRPARTSAPTAAMTSRSARPSTSRRARRAGTASGAPPAGATPRTTPYPDS